MNKEYDIAKLELTDSYNYPNDYSTKYNSSNSIFIDSGRIIGNFSGFDDVDNDNVHIWIDGKKRENKYKRKLFTIINLNDGLIDNLKVSLVLYNMVVDYKLNKKLKLQLNMTNNEIELLERKNKILKDKIKDKEYELDKIRVNHRNYIKKTSDIRTELKELNRNSEYHSDKLLKEENIKLKERIEYLEKREPDLETFFGELDE